MQSGSKHFSSERKLFLNVSFAISSNEPIEAATVIGKVMTVESVGVNTLPAVSGATGGYPGPTRGGCTGGGWLGGDGGGEGGGGNGGGGEGGGGKGGGG